MWFRWRSWLWLHFSCGECNVEIRGIQWYPSQYTFGSVKGKLSLDELKAAIPHCNYIFLNGFCDVSASANTATVRTSSMPDLDVAITYAHSLGFKVALRIKGAEWLKPSNPILFLTNWADAVQQWAIWAQARNVELFGVGGEAEYLEYDAYSPQWRNIIAKTRQVYSGTIYYNTNTWWSKADRYTPGGENCIGLNAKLAASWMNDLDYIAISAYPNLTNTSNHPPYPNAPSVDQLIAAWHYYQMLTDMHGDDLVSEHYQLLSQHFAKKIIFHCGIASKWGNTNQPYDFSAGQVCLDEQTNWITALFTVFNPLPWMEGYLFDGSWICVPLAEKPPNNYEFTIQNKPAQQVVADYYAVATPNNYSLLILLGLAVILLAS